MPHYNGSSEHRSRLDSKHGGWKFWRNSEITRSNTGPASNMGMRTLCRADLRKLVKSILCLYASTPPVMTLGVLRVDGSQDEKRRNLSLTFYRDHHSTGCTPSSKTTI